MRLSLFACTEFAPGSPALWQCVYVCVCMCKVVCVCLCAEHPQGSDVRRTVNSEGLSSSNPPFALCEANYASSSHPGLLPLGYLTLASWSEHIRALQPEWVSEPL